MSDQRPETTSTSSKDGGSEERLGEDGNSPADDSVGNFGLDDALRQLNGLSVAHWSIWIRSLLEGVPCKPHLHLGHTTPDRVLIWLFETGLDTTVRFIEALGRVYEGSTPTRPRQLYYLLQAIAVTKPDLCRDLLLRHLKEKRFDLSTFRGSSLKTIALATRSRYGIDAELYEFVLRSAELTDDFGYRLACFRTLADANPRDACHHIDLILPHLANSKEQRVFGGLLRGMAWTESNRPLFEWFNSPDRDRLAAVQPDRLDSLKAVMRRWLVPWRPSSLEADPWGVLLSAQVFAGHRPFVAEEIRFIGRTANARLMSSPFRVSETLRILWDGTVEHVREWCSPEFFVPSWDYCLPWMGPPNEAQVIQTDWKEDILQREIQREYFSQRVEVTDSAGRYDDIVSAVVSRGARPMPAETGNTDDGRSIEEEFDAAFDRLSHADSRHQVESHPIEPIYAL